MQASDATTEFDYESFVLMEPTAQTAYVEACTSVLGSAGKVVVINGPDAGRKFGTADELREWLSLE